MSRKTKKKRETAAPPTSPRRPLWRKGRLIVAACLLLLGSAYAGTRLAPVRRAVGLAPLPAPVTQGQGTLPLAREYIYAGGRLVATEEPQPTTSPTPAGPAPTNLRAAATSTAAVHLEWDAPAGGSPTSYVLERRDSIEGQPVEIATGSNSLLFDDSLAPGDHAYLYRVKAVYGGGYSVYGNYDLATTVPFTDEQLQGTFIKAEHLTQLRRAVRAVRTLAGKGEPTWTHPDPVSTPASSRRAIYLADVTDLRTQVDEALTALDTALNVQLFFKPYPSEPGLTWHGTVYAAHFEQIRERVR